MRIMNGLLALAVLFSIQAMPPKAVAAQNQRPIFLLNSGGHTSNIRSITFTPDGNHLISASDDKLIRVWNWRTKKTERVIRGQIDQEDMGMIYAMALSPDGKWLAAGGWTDDNEIRLYDFASGEIVALLKGHTDVVMSLAFSTDSKRLISGSADYNAMIWDVEQKKLLHLLEGHTDLIYAADFIPPISSLSPNGSSAGEQAYRAVTGSDDHDLRLWDANTGKLIRVMQGHTGMVRTLAVSKNGLIASGSEDYTIRTWDGKTGMPVDKKTRAEFITNKHAPALLSASSETEAIDNILTNQDSQVGQLSFSPDGRALLSSCRSDGCSEELQYLYDVASGKVLVAYEGHDEAVIATAISPDGRFAATAGGDNQEVHVWDIKTGEQRAVMKGVGAVIWSAGFSKDGQKIVWGKRWEEMPYEAQNPMEYSLRLPSADRDLGTIETVGMFSSKFQRAQMNHDDLHLKHAEGGDYDYSDAILEILHEEEVIASFTRDATDGYCHNTYTFTPDGKTVISGGGSGVIESYDLEGNVTGEFLGHSSDIWAVAVSPDGRLLISGGGDQTVRLWNAETHELIVTLFHGEDGEWAMWTTQGYYTASIHGHRLLGWHLNRGPDKSADHLSGEQLRNFFYAPEIINRAILLGSAKLAVEEIDGEENTLTDLLESGIPPKVRITSHSTSGSPDKVMKVVAEAEDQGGGVGKVEWRVNGATFAAQNQKLSQVNKTEYRLEGQFSLKPGDNVIELVVYNKQDSISSKPYRLTVNTPK